jgi:signal transduction histidine kinase
VVAEDVTEQRRAEALRVEKEAVEAASRAKSLFLANMSHELRTPLTAILGYCELLQEQASDEGRPEVLADLNHIAESGRHLLGLVNDILDLSKIEAGRMVLCVEPFDVAAMLGEACAAAGPLMGRHGNAFTTVIPDDLGTAMGDCQKTRQILLNLLGNAAKFTSRGSVHLAASRRREPDGDWLTFTIRDSGIGMSSSQREQLFRPFVQVDASLSRRHGGTGLGLAISGHLCRILGGSIAVESALGEGSVFEVRLPSDVRAGQPRPGEVPAPPQSVLSPATSC